MLAGSTILRMIAATEPAEPQQGLDFWVLFSSIALFLAIVVVITLLRRWK
jgi:hypothetical protein